jgi:hypothetical protein
MIEMLIEIGSIVGACMGLMLVGFWGYFLIMEAEDE